MANLVLQQDDRALFAQFLFSRNVSGWLDTLELEARARISEYLLQEYGLNLELTLSNPPLQPSQNALERPTSADRRKIVSPDFPDAIDLAEFIRWATFYQQAFSSFEFDTFSYCLNSGNLEQLRRYLVERLERLVRTAQQPQILEESNIVPWTKDMGLKAIINIYYHLASLLPSESTRVFSENDNWSGLSRLRYLVEPEDTMSTLETSSADAIKESFHSTYLDPAGQVIRILSHINEYACKWSVGKEQSLGPFTSLVQSSMFGKSRLLREMSHYVPVIYMSLRAEKSTDVSNFLHGYPRGHTRLGNWFDLIGASEKYTPNIEQMLGHAIVLFSRRLQGLPLCNGFVDLFDYLAEDPTFWNQVVTQSDQLLEQQDLVNALAKITEHNKESRFPGLLILAVDEANRLLPSERGKSSATVDRFRTFRQVLARMFVGMKVFAIVTDTFAKVADFAPPIDGMTTSARGLEEKGHKAFYPPVYLLNTMHIHARTFYICFDSRNILSFPRLIAFGRPAFYDLYTRMKPSLRSSPEDRILQIAAAKLIMQGDLTAGHLNDLFDPIKSAITPASIALFALLLAIFPSAQSTQSAEIVASHMAPLWYVNEHRTVLHVKYASEPAMCLGALRIYSLARVHLIQSLPKLLKHTQVSRAYRGEFVGRLLPLDCLARLRLRLNATTKADVDTEMSEPDQVSESDEEIFRESCGLLNPFTRGAQSEAFCVTVGKFLEGFVGIDIVSRIFSMNSEQLPMSTEDRSQILKGKIHANHWVQLEKAPSRRELAILLNQGAMALMPRDHIGVDAIIPVLLEAGPEPKSKLPIFTAEDLPSGENCIEEENLGDWQHRISYILFQYKNYKDTLADDHWAKARYTMSSQHIGLDNESAPAVPYISIFQQFGSHALTNVRRCLLSGQKPSTKQFVYSHENDVRAGSKNLVYPGHEARQITIVLAGLDEETYPIKELLPFFGKHGTFADLLVDSFNLSDLHADDDWDGGVIRAAFPGLYPSRSNTL